MVITVGPVAGRDGRILAVVVVVSARSIVAVEGRDRHPRGGTPIGGGIVDGAMVDIGRGRRGAGCQRLDVPRDRRLMVVEIGLLHYLLQFLDRVIGSHSPRLIFAAVAGQSTPGVHICAGLDIRFPSSIRLHALGFDRWVVGGLHGKFLGTRVRSMTGLECRTLGTYIYPQDEHGVTRCSTSCE